MTKGRFRSISVVAGVLLGLILMAGIAFANGSAPKGPPVVHGKHLNNPGPGPVVHAVSIHQASGSLPFTGADVILFLGIGLVVFAAGLMLYRRSRPVASSS